MLLSGRQFLPRRDRLSHLWGSIAMFRFLEPMAYSASRTGGWSHRRLGPFGDVEVVVFEDARHDSECAGSPGTCRRPRP